MAKFERAVHIKSRSTNVKIYYPIINIGEGETTLWEHPFKTYTQAVDFSRSHEAALIALREQRQKEVREAAEIEASLLREESLEAEAQVLGDIADLAELG